MTEITMARNEEETSLSSVFVVFSMPPSSFLVAMTTATLLLSRGFGSLFRALDDNM
jgi:hypothetical protein